MRELKFRAWSTKHGCWHYFTLVDLLVGRVTQPLRYENWCQFTGLHDKNDVEIYEGDRVEVDGGGEKKGRGIIEMQDGCWGFVADWYGTPFVELKYYTDMVFCEIEVISKGYV